MSESSHLAMRHPIAIQTITWGDPQHERFDEIFRCCADAGASGLEIGLRRLSQRPLAEIKHLLHEHGLRLTATHLGGNLLDRDQADSERDQLDQAIATVKELGAELLFYSGCRDSDPAVLDPELAMLATAAQRCRAHGLRLCYHNHDWEFADDSHIFKTIRARIPDLGYVLDLGWLHKAGVDALALLAELGEQVAALHFKDFASLDATVDTVALGTGVVPMTQVLDWLGKRRSPCWLIAEQDHATQVEQDVLHNGAWLRQLTDCGAPS